MICLGTTKIKNLHENVGSVNVKLTDDDLKEICEAVPVEEVAGGRQGEALYKISWKFANTPQPKPKWNNIYNQFSSMFFWNSTFNSYMELNDWWLIILCRRWMLVIMKFCWNLLVVSLLAFIYTLELKFVVFLFSGNSICLLLRTCVKEIS